MCKFKAVMFAVLLVFSMSLTATVWAAVVYDESVNGDLSNDENAPTTLSFSVGSNQLLGSVGVNDRDDYFNFIIAPGQTVDSIILDSYVSSGQTQTQSSSIDAWAFFIPFQFPGFSGTFGINDIGNEIGLGVLPPGSYSFLLNEGGFAAVADYTFSFNVSSSPVPSPSTMLLMGTGLLGLIGYRKWSTKNS